MLEPMFEVYIRDYNQNGNVISQETLVQSVPALDGTENSIRLLTPVGKAEMGNAESFNFSIESGTEFYDAFLQMKTFIRIVYDGDTIFFGRVLTIDNDFYGNRKIRCEGPLAFLNDTYIEGVEESKRQKQTTFEFLSKVIEGHNAMVNDPKRQFALGEVPGLYSEHASPEQQIKNESRKYGQDGWTDTKGVIEDLRSHYGGYLRVRYNEEASGSDPCNILDWMDHYFMKYNQIDNPQAIEVAYNVLDISTTTEVDNIFTVVIPIGNSKTASYETADGEKKSSGPKHFYVPGREVTVPSIVPYFDGKGISLNSGYHTREEYAQALNRYGRIVKTVTFDDAENSEQLLEKCYDWIKNNYQGEVTKFSVKAIDIHQIGDRSISKIMIGDQVKIYYPVYDEDGRVLNQNGTPKFDNVIYTCLSISYDLYNPENNTYTFGIPANILTKSYGVTKQGNSTQQPSTTPKSSGGGGSTKTEDWLDKVTAWLGQHKICYRHNVNVIANGPNGPTLGMDSAEGHIDTIAQNALGPGKIIKSHEKGPYSGVFRDHQNYIYDTEYSVGAELVSGFTLWKCIPGETGSTGSEAELNKIIADKRAALQAAGAPSTAIEQIVKSTRTAYWLEHPSTTNWTAHQVVLEGILSYNALNSCNIINYVKQEYGIDLKNFDGVKMPENIEYTDDEGTELKVGVNEDGYVVTREMYSPYYKPNEEDVAHGFRQITTSDGRVVVSQLDKDGEWHYTVYDKDTGQSVETYIRELDLHVVEAADFFGQAATQGRNPMVLDENGHPYEYRFGQGIEKWADGEIVTGVVDGDVVKIGSKVTQYSTVIAQNISGSWIRPVEFYVDNADPNNLRYKAKHGSITVGQAGTAQYEAYLSKNMTPPQYIPVPKGLDRLTPEELLKWKQDNIYNYPQNDITVFVGAGTWDTDNLAIKGGIYTVVENNQPVTYIASKQLVMGDRKTVGTIRDVLIKAGLFQHTVDGKVQTVTYEDYLADPTLIDMDNSIVTPVLMASNIYADKISANTANIKKIETDYLNATWIKDTIAIITDLNVGNLTGTGDDPHITTGTFTSTENKYLITIAAGQEDQATTYRNLADGVRTLKIFGPDPTTKEYKLKAYNYTENPATDAQGTDETTGWVIGTFRSYAGGWDAAQIELTWPEGQENDDDYTSAITIRYPSSTVDVALARSFTMSDDNLDAKNTVQLRGIIPSTSGGTPISYKVAKYSHNKYNAGWNAARIKVSIPTSEASGESISIGYPTTTVDGAPTVQNYTIANHASNNDKVILRTPVEKDGTTKYVTVAEFTHGKYTAGQTSLPYTLSSYTVHSKVMKASDVSGWTKQSNADYYVQDNTSGTSIKARIYTYASVIVDEHTISTDTVSKYDYLEGIPTQIYKDGYNAGKASVPAVTAGDLVVGSAGSGSSAYKPSDYNWNYFKSVTVTNTWLQSSTTKPSGVTANNGEGWDMTLDKSTDVDKRYYYLSSADNGMAAGGSCWYVRKVLSGGGGGVTPQAISLNTETSGGSYYYAATKTALAYAMGISENSLTQIFSPNKVYSGQYYGFKVNCGSASNSGRAYYFMT